MTAAGQLAAASVIDSGTVTVTVTIVLSLCLASARNVNSLWHSNTGRLAADRLALATVNHD
jgi:hypothetical protein